MKNLLKLMMISLLSLSISQYVQTDDNQALAKDNLVKNQNKSDTRRIAYDLAQARKINPNYSEGDLYKDYDKKIKDYLADPKHSYFDPYVDNLKRIQLKLRTRKSNLSLMRSIEEGDLNKFMQILNDPKTDITQLLDDYGQSVWLAAALGQDKMVQQLIKAGANVNTSDTYGSTPLYMASALSNNTRNMQALIDAGANVNKPDDRGDTPIFNTAFFGLDKNMELLLNADANVNVSNIFGETPLYASINTNSEGSDKVADLLIKHGANVNEVVYGQTLLERATELNSDGSRNRIIDLLKAAGAHN